jgi:hypothetical protein
MTFEEEEITFFLDEAPNDDQWLVVKMDLIFGTYGCLRKHERVNLEFEQVGNKAPSVCSARKTGRKQSTKYFPHL